MPRFTNGRTQKLLFETINHVPMSDKKTKGFTTLTRIEHFSSIEESTRVMDSYYSILLNSRHNFTS